MRSNLFSSTEDNPHPGLTLQNRKLLRMRMQNGEFFAKQGAMVAYQGAIDFAYQGSGVKRFLKQAVSGEDLSLMSVTGSGDVYLARDAWDIHLIDLEGDAVSVNAENVLAFDGRLDWDVSRVSGGSIAAGGLFNTVFSGHGRLAIACHGEPVLLNVNAPTFADTKSVVAWSASLHTGIRSTVKAGALIGRGSGEAFQVSFEGRGFVIVQASEGEKLPVQQS